MVKVALNLDNAAQLELFSSASMANAEAEIVPPSALFAHDEGQLISLLKFLNKPQSKGSGCVSATKASASTGSKNQYFRYTYRLNGKQRTKSIPGGNIRSPLAQRRARQIKECILKGMAIPEILYVIGSFTAAKN